MLTASMVPTQRPLWRTIALWVLLFVFLGLFLQQTGVLVRGWQGKKQAIPLPPAHPR